MPRVLARLAVRPLEDRTTPSTLIPVSGPRDLVYDAARNRLYVTTASGQLVRYNVATGTLLSPLALGPSHNGADITPDGRYLFVASDQTTPFPVVFHKVDLAAEPPTSTAIGHSSSSESGSWDIAIGPSGVALTVARSTSSGPVQVRFLDTATNAFTPAGQTVGSNNPMVRSADRSVVALARPGDSQGPFWVYRFGVGFSPPVLTQMNLIEKRFALSRDGGLFASEVDAATAVVAPNFEAVQTFVGLDGGMAFDPGRNVLYGVNATTDELVAYDTVTWREKYRLPVGQNVAESSGIGPGAIAVSDDGTKLFLITTTGVRQFDLPADTGVAAQLQFSNVSVFRSTGTATTVTVTARDPAGNLVPNYAGTVTFTSTDPAAVLPDPYTFTPGDGGTKTFPVTWNTTGSRTLTASDAGNGIVGTTPAVTVHNQAAPLIPVPNRRDLVFDAAHNLLLITTSTGRIERYDPATRSLLAPIIGTSSYTGADITVDGTTLVVADDQRSLTQSLIYRIDPLTGAMAAPLRHSGDDGAWDVILAADGTGLADYGFAGSGSVSLDRIDLAAGTLAPTGRQVAQNTSLNRGFDRSSFFIYAPSNSTSQTLVTYNPATGTFPTSVTVSALLAGSVAAVDRTAARIAMEYEAGVVVMTPAFNTTQLYGNLLGGLAYDPIRDVLYGVDVAADRIKAFDSVTGTLLYSMPAGEDVPTSNPFDNGIMTSSSDGRWLFLSTPSGVRAYDLAPRVSVTVVPGSVAPGAPAELRVTALNPGGGVDASYRGTVTFTSSDPAATLPDPYTFTATDAGTRSFPAAFRSFGAQSVTATDGTSLTVAGTVTVRPTRVVAVAANPGAVQRSRVTSLAVTFDTVVTFANPNDIAAAFTVSRIGGASVGAVTATATVVNGVTVVTLSGFAGTETEFGSLADGRYAVTVRAGQVSAGGAALDGNDDGTAGDDFTLAGTVANGLFRLFGDTSGDGTVNAFDYSTFRPAFGSSIGQSAYLDFLDFDGNGVINAFDFAQFRTRFGSGVP